jgi:hypothetical protein
MTENCQAKPRVRPPARDRADGPENARARAPAREGRAFTVRAVRVPKDSRRVPLVLVDVERAGLRLVFAVARLRGGALDVRPPRGPDGTGAGIWLPARERGRVRAAILAAVDGSPEARAMLRPYG